MNTLQVRHHECKYIPSHIQYRRHDEISPYRAPECESCARVMCLSSLLVVLSLRRVKGVRYRSRNNEKPQFLSPSMPSLVMHGVSLSIYAYSDESSMSKIRMLVRSTPWMSSVCRFSLELSSHQNSRERVSISLPIYRRTISLSE